MGLISKCNPVKGIFNASSEESLHISDPPSEDENPLPQPPLVRQAQGHKGRVRPVPMSFTHLRKCLGKKKSRRYEGVNQLMTLVEEEEFGEVSIEDLAPMSDSQFAHLLNDSSSMAKWNEFVESPEETQQQLLDKVAVKGHQKPRRGEVLSGEAAYLNIDSSIRAVLRKNIPLGMLSCMESSVVSFFTEKPLETFVSDVLSSFERLLLHAISQYHQLFSLSFDDTSAPKKCGRFVRIVNPHQDFRVPFQLLGDFLTVRKQGPLSTNK